MPTNILGRVLTGEEGWVYDSEITGELERNGNDSLYLQGRLTYQGYPTDVRFSLTVDLTAEAVTNYYRYDAYMTFDGAQASTDSTVDQQTALEKLKGLVTVEPVYQVVQNGQMAKLVYRFTGLDGKVVRCSDWRNFGYRRIFPGIRPRRRGGGIRHGVSVRQHAADGGGAPGRGPV